MSTPFRIVIAAALCGSLTSGFIPTRLPTNNKLIPVSATPDTTSSSSDTSTDSDSKIYVALTREKGKNGKLQEKLADHPAIKMMGIELDIAEMPSIEHAQGDDKQELIDLLSSDEQINNFDYIVITSPEAARVFASAMEESSTDSLNNADITVAAVGKATSKALEKLGIKVGFVPSQANGETLAAELPPTSDGDQPTKVLYPASAKARNDIQEGLEARGKSDDDNDDATIAVFELKRLNTYDTVPKAYTEEELASIDHLDIACFGSPSAVEAWLQNIDVKGGYTDLDEEEKKKLGPDGNGNVVAACIGTTSARACLESGRWHAMDIYYPKENPGVESWAASIAQASGDVFERKFWS